MIPEHTWLQISHQSLCKIHELERILENEKDGHSRGGFEVGLDVSEATIRRIVHTMSTVDYHKCLACQRAGSHLKRAAVRNVYA